MTSQPNSLVTPDHYVAAFNRFASNGASEAPAWVAETRQAAIGRFAERGFPTTRQEAWRFTNLKPILRHGFVLAPQKDGRITVADIDAHRIDPSIPVVVLVNGRFAPELTQVPDIEGVTVTSLRQAMQDHETLVRSHLTKHAKDEENPFVSLSAAFIDDGTFVHVAANAQAGSMQIIHTFVADGERAEVAHPRTLIVVDAGGSASIVESFVTFGTGVTWTNSVTELVVGQNAQLDAYRLQDESLDAFHTASTWSWQERDSRLTNLIFTFGGTLTRHDIVSVLDGEGAESTLNGLSILGGRQHVDYHTVLDHAKPHCKSWEYFNGIFDGRSRGIFNGRIIVREGAQKTDAKQTNNNLLLTNTARADSQPQLEIYADDVKCTHGATLGPIDEAHLFYMQSRGLTREHARRLLTHGFASEILNGVALVPLRQRLDAMVHDRLRTEIAG
jgi:Fe-S cluster assembly protein SufD